MLLPHLNLLSRLKSSLKYSIVEKYCVLIAIWHRVSYPWHAQPVESFLKELYSANFFLHGTFICFHEKTLDEVRGCGGEGKGLKMKLIGIVLTVVFKCFSLYVLKWGKKHREDCFQRKLFLYVFLSTFAADETPTRNQLHNEMFSF